MKNTSRKPYIYKVTDLETGQYYIGSQCSGKTIGVNYFTSSTNKAFLEGFENYGEEKYKIEIIKEFDDWKKCNRAENYMIRNYMLLKDGLCLNKGCVCGNGEKIFSRVGVHLDEKTKQKLREANKGHSPWNKGRPSPNKGIHLSEETRQKMSETRKGVHLSEETKQKISLALKGIPLSEETRQKMSRAKKRHPVWNKGIHHSEETKQKISLALKIKISIDGVVFDSLTEAAKYYNVSRFAIRYWVKKNQHNAFLIEN